MDDIPVREHLSPFFARPVAVDVARTVFRLDDKDPARKDEDVIDLTGRAVLRVV